MKTTIVKLFLSVFTLTLGFLNSNAQDVITKKDKTTINAKILEIGLDEIKYLPFDNQTGPVMSIDKTDIFKIKYEKGQEWFNAPDQYSASPATEVRDKNRAIKFEFFSPLFGKLTFGYEQMIKVGTNVEFKLGIIGPSLNEGAVSDNPSGVFVKLGPKFLLGSEFRTRGTTYTHALIGKYFKPELIFSTFNQDYSSSATYNYFNNSATPGITTRYRTSSVALCLNYGKQYILGNIMTLDWYFGVGYGFQNTELKDLVKKNSNYNGYSESNDDYVPNCFSHLYGGPSFPIVFQAGLTLGVLAR